MRRRLFIFFCVTFLCGLSLAPAGYAAPQAGGVSRASACDIETFWSSYLSVYPLVSPYAMSLEDIRRRFPGLAYMSAKWQSHMLTEKKIAKREEGLDMKGVLPVLDEAYGAAAQDINAQIDSAVSTKVSEAKEIKARTITFDYAMYETESLVSLIILSTVVSASAKTEVTSVNFEPAGGRLVALSEAVGVDIKPLAEKLIAEKIRRNPEKYNAAFTGVLPEQQAYYLEADKLVLLFNEFSLRSGAEGITPLELTLANVETVTITKDDYIVKPGYNVKMVPLRMICEGIGYEVVWTAEDARIEIFRDKALVMEMSLGANNYLVRDKKVRSLEAPPEVDKGIAYVPISFFDQILSLVTYSVDSHESITFLSYTE